MDIEHEEELRRNILLAWNDGGGDIDEVQQAVNSVSTRMYDDENVAKFHFNVINQVAEGPLQISAAHMILVDCYRRGWSVTPDPTKSLEHLQSAIRCGDERARWFLGEYLLGDEKLSSVLPPDSERAIDIFIDLANNAKDLSVKQLALTSAGSYIVEHFNSDEASDDYKELVDQYVSDPAYIRSKDYYHLALFYAGQALGNDYDSPQYRKSREFLIAGSKSRIEKVSDECKAMLVEWGVRPQQEVPDLQPKKAVEKLKVLGGAVGITLILVIWSSIGLFFLSVIAVMDAAIIPIILALVVVGLIVTLIRGKSG